MIKEVKIVPSKHGQCDIYIDGQEMKHVTAVQVDMRVNCTPKVNLEFLSQKVFIELPEAEVQDGSD